jgi:hypothetical protein
MSNGTTEKRRTVYHGPFVHSKALNELDICEKGVIGVDENGKIAFVERDQRDAKTVAQEHGWGTCDVVTVGDNGFFFPGFIGMFDVLFVSISWIGYAEKSSGRTRIQI